MKCWPVAAHSTKVNLEMKNANELYLLDLESTSAQLEILNSGTLSPAARQRIWEKAMDRAAAASPASAQRAPLLSSIFKAFSLQSFGAALAFILILGVVGIPLAASSSLPGSALYPAKRNLESTWLALVPEAQKPEIQLRIFDQRIREMDQLIEAQQPVPEELIRELETFYAGVAQTPDTWDEPETMQHLAQQITVLQSLEDERPGVEAPLTGIFLASAAAYDSLGGDVAALQLDDAFLTSTPTATSTSTSTPTSTATATLVPTFTPLPTSTATPAPTTAPLPTLPPSSLLPEGDTPLPESEVTVDPEHPVHPEHPEHPEQAQNDKDKDDKDKDKDKDK